MNTNKKPTPVNARIRRHLKMAIIPHKANQYRPHAVRRYGIAAVLLLVVLMQGMYNGITTGSVLGAEADITISGLLDGTNNARIADGKSRLLINVKLTKAAEMKAQDMFTKQYWAHTSPDGTTPWHWFGAVGYSYAEAGENLAKNFSASDSVITAWLQSSTHRANLLKATYTDVGFAVMSGEMDGQEATIVVALYGTPAEVAVQGLSTATHASTTSEPLSFMARLGVGLQSLTPAAIASVVMLLLAANIALVAHLYRRKLPKSLRKSWYRHHGLYKAIGFTTLAVTIVLMYGSAGQI